MGEYSYPRYEGIDPGNGATAIALAARFTGLVAGLPDVKNICDLGCGNGYLSGLLLQGGYRVVGVDGSESGIAIARRTYGDRGEFVCARIDTAVSARIGGARFDAVISCDVIEHLYRPADLLECARELLVPRGWLVLGTPYHGYLKNLALSVMDGWDAHHTVDWDGGHIKFFRVRTLLRAVEAAGFQVQRFEFYGRAPWLWKNMICVPKAKS